MHTVAGTILQKPATIMVGSGIYIVFVVDGGFSMVFVFWVACIAAFI
jgi:hypothetical protein